MITGAPIQVAGRQGVEDQPPKRGRPQQAGIVHWHHHRHGAQLQRIGHRDLRTAAQHADRGQARPAERPVVLGDRHVEQRQRHQRQRRKPEDGGQRRLGPANLTQQDGDARRPERTAQRKGRAAQRQMPVVGGKARRRDDQHAGEPRHHRSPAPHPGRLAQHERAQNRRDQRHGEADRRRLGERQQHDTVEGQRHRAQPHHCSGDMRRQSLCRDARHAGTTGDDGRHQQRRAELAKEQDLDHARTGMFGQLDARIHRGEEHDRQQAQADRGQDAVVHAVGCSGKCLRVHRSSCGTARFLRYPRAHFVIPAKAGIQTR